METTFKSQPLSFPDKPPILLLDDCAANMCLSYSHITYHTGYKKLRSKEVEKPPQRSHSY